MRAHYGLNFEGTFKSLMRIHISHSVCGAYLGQGQTRPDPMALHRQSTRVEEDHRSRMSHFQ